MSNKQFETLEDALDLPNISDIENETPPSKEEVQLALEKAKTLEEELGRLNSRDEHDEEMDELANMAVQAHKDLQDLGMNVEIRYAGEIFGSSSQMLKIAVDAKNLKMEKKLRMLRLQLDKMRLDRSTSNNDSSIIEGSATKIDRNELVKMLKEMPSKDK